MVCAVLLSVVFGVCGVGFAHCKNLLSITLREPVPSPLWLCSIAACAAATALLRAPLLNSTNAKCLSGWWKHDTISACGLAAPGSASGGSTAPMAASFSSKKACTAAASVSGSEPA